MATNLDVQYLFDPNEIDNAGAETLYTVASTPTTIIVRNIQVNIVNTTGTAATITVWAVPSGRSADDTTAVLKDYSVNGADYLTLNIPELDAAATLQAQAGTANAITISSLGGTIYT